MTVVRPTSQVRRPTVVVLLLPEHHYKGDVDRSRVFESMYIFVVLTDVTTCPVLSDFTDGT